MIKVSIIIPAYNEENSIKKIINKIQKLNFKKLKIKNEIIVIDDGSTDNTLKICRNIKGIKLITQKNFGKGRAVQNGIRKAKGEYILIQDADLEYDPKDYFKLLNPKYLNTTTAIYGSRYLINNKLRKNQNIGPFIFNKILSLWFWIFFKVFISDLLTGYKVYPIKFFKNHKIITNGFETDHEITSKLIKSNYAIKEVPIKYLPRTKLQGKKINIFDAFKAIFTIVKFKII